MTNKTKETIDLYRETQDLIAQAFCDKFDLYIENKLPGGAGYEIADLFISIEDMITVLEEDFTFEQFLQWYDYAFDIHMENSNQDSKKADKHIVNLRNYVKYGKQLIKK